jgi:hypothetical protein
MLHIVALFVAAVFARFANILLLRVEVHCLQRF